MFSPVNIQKNISQAPNLPMHETESEPVRQLSRPHASVAGLPVLKRIASHSKAWLTVDIQCASFTIPQTVLFIMLYSPLLRRN